jgi:Glucose / Sorbosone dehydrogenase
MEEIRRESMLWELRQRIREVRQGPDGLLYLLTDEGDANIVARRTPRRNNRAHTDLHFTENATILLSLIRS